MGNLTVHTVVRDEPFVYYAIKSVYDYVDVILLYDTGSTDDTMDDIQRLLAEDHLKKIHFEHIPIIDETGWKKFAVHKAMAQSKRNFELTGKNMSFLRRKQIEETTTPFFLLLDGDEICHRATIEYLRDNPIPDDMICHCIRREWYTKLTQKYQNRGPVPRLFRTEAVELLREYPDEYHSYKGTNRCIKRHHRTSVMVPKRIPPIVHFEPYLKPWRGRRSDVTLIDTRWEDLPEVMLENDYFVRRLEKKRGQYASSLQADEGIDNNCCPE